MEQASWDDLLDDYEDTLDAYNDALDQGQTLSAMSTETPAPPSDAPTLEQRERFGELTTEAKTVSARLLAALDANERSRSQDQLRVDAHREYSGSSTPSDRARTKRLIEHNNY